MKILKRIFKILGIATLVSVVIFIGLLFIGMWMFGSNEKKVNSRALVKSKEFKSLHQSVISLDSIENIAVLPDENYIVIDGTVINLAKQTFGNEPALGFYFAYYKEGDSLSYTSLDNLLSARNIKTDSITAMAVINGMKSTGISDIGIIEEGVSYRWKVSAMYGEEGILYSKQLIPKDSTIFDVFDKLEDNFYHFVIYDK